MDGTLRILDVRERNVGAVRPPSFPTPQPTASGFPQPKKRSRFASTLKQRQTAAAPTPEGASTATPSKAAPASSGLLTDEKSRIDRENDERLRQMGPQEIEEARKELLSNLDPALLQILLRRANLDDASNDAGPLPGDAPPPQIRIDDTTASKDEANKTMDTKAKTKKSVSFAATPSLRATTVEDVPEDGEPGSKQDRHFDHSSGDAALLDHVPPPSAEALAPISAPEAAISGHGHDGAHAHAHGSTSMHFPQSPSVPDLDPADPDFLEHLHKKYFPNLPADPARLAWMAPLPTPDSPADRESPYYPGQASVAVSQLRFDFRGRLIPPRLSRQIPASKGLHHHGLAPEAAGYTVGELALLARSAVPAQRCVAFQTLGRILYRLGRGEWGDGLRSTNPQQKQGTDGNGDGDDNQDKDGNDDENAKEAAVRQRSELAAGIWQCLREGRVLDSLHEAANVEEGRGHQGSRAYAIEAIWLFEKGGWKERWQSR